ncbi:MAG: transcriptional regulator GcvA [Rhodospirillaceae bacterium]|nr:transcriptional regulator GcvA [Rhodospirillaceae bacterium]MBT6830862.1 transcriptional regulator GcvA [Rhodospirillaceae bacterium]
MSRRLPPLNAVRAFEAAARHLSFTHAADELNVTQAAISHQIKTLEQWLGLPLFRRLNRAVSLTEEGAAYLPAASQALDGLAGATAHLLRSGDTRSLTVTTLDSFAAQWLMPRLKHFRALYPEIDVRILASDERVDFNRHDVDMAIRYGAGNWPDLVVIPLMTEELFPVCSPALLRGRHPLEKPEDLVHHTLLHDDLSFENGDVDWRTWLRTVGADHVVDSERGPFFEHSHLVVQAAIDGQGVALGRGVLVADAMADGRLVRPFDSAGIPLEYAYYIAHPEGAMRRPSVAAFSNWLREEARTSQENSNVEYTSLIRSSGS